MRKTKSTQLILFFLCFLLFSTLNASAQTDSNSTNANAPQQFSFSLKQAIDYAVTNKPAVQNAVLDEAIAKKKVAEIRGIGLPQINGTAEFTDYLITPKVILPASFRPPGAPETISFQQPYNLNLGLSASQLIFDGSYIVGLQASNTYAQLSRKNTKRTKIEAAAEVTKAYFGVIINEKRRNLIDANITRLSQTYNDTKALNEEGFVEKIDVDRLKVALNNLEVEKQKLDNFISLSYYLLKFQMGMPVDAQLTLTDSIDENNIKAPVQEKANYANRVEFSLLETQKRLYELDLRKNYYGYLPSVAVFAALSTQAQRDSFDIFEPNKSWLNTALIGARITVPIFDGFQKSARIQQSKLTLQKTENDMQSLKNAIDLELAQATITYENNYKTLETQRQNLALAEEIVRVSQIKYNEGVGSNLEVITAEASLKEAQTNYFSALYDLTIAQVNLQKAKGTLY